MFGTITAGAVVAGAVVGGLVGRGAVVGGQVGSGAVLGGLARRGVVVGGLVDRGAVVGGLVGSGAVVGGLARRGVVVGGLVDRGAEVGGLVALTDVGGGLVVTAPVVGGPVEAGGATVVGGAVTVTATVVGGPVVAGCPVTVVSAPAPGSPTDASGTQASVPAWPPPTSPPALNSSSSSTATTAIAAIQSHARNDAFLCTLYSWPPGSTDPIGGRPPEDQPRVSPYSRTSTRWCGAGRSSECRRNFASKDEQPAPGIADGAQGSQSHPVWRRGRLVDHVGEQALDGGDGLVGHHPWHGATHLGGGEWPLGPPGEPVTAAAQVWRCGYGRTEAARQGSKRQRVAP
jgi:hypothetical protein